MPAPYLVAVWNEVAPYLQRAVAVTNGRFELEDVRRGIETGRYDLWVAYAEGEILGAEVTTIVEYPRKRALCSLFTGGKRLREWREPMMDLLIRFARDAGCQAIEGQGRASWVKLLEPYGVREMAVLFERDV